LQTTTLATAATCMYVPQRVFGANDKIGVASIGVGGKGTSDVKGSDKAGAKIVALCDVDAKRAKKTLEAYPDRPLYHDFRKMLDQEDKHIDAVTVSTPDHVHAVAAVRAMRMGKHCYCQKPLTRTIWEARRVAETAKECGVATQMGNQAHAGESIRRAVELLRAGLLGEVREVHTWTNRPIWPQGMTERPEPKEVPEGLHWDLWLGPAKSIPYGEGYCPFKWRGWWDFGAGALGDMGCHIMDMPYWALDLAYPKTVEATQEGNTPLAAPLHAHVTYTFPKGPYSAEDLKFHWWDGIGKGGEYPPAEIFAEFNLSQEQGTKQFGAALIGDKGKLLFNRGKMEWLCLPEDRLVDFREKTPKTLPRTSNEDVEWIEACKGGPAALSNFSNSGPFTEVVLLGNLAVRLGHPIEWDGPNMKAINTPEAETLIKPDYREGWL
jgi:predicted dehydrogenase